MRLSGSGEASRRPFCLIIPILPIARYAPEPNPETKKKDVVWFALNDERPLCAFAGIWTEFNGDRGTKSETDPRPSPGLRLPDGRPGIGGRLPRYRFITRKSAMIAAWFVVIEYRLHTKFSPILRDESCRRPSNWTEFRSPGYGRSAATLPRSEPRPIGMGLADPSAVVASPTELHDSPYPGGVSGW
jgi:hypothetical protein